MSICKRCHKEDGECIAGYEHVFEEQKTPSILIPALRQYQHNDCSGLLAGFDYDETIKIVSQLRDAVLEAVDNMKSVFASGGANLHTKSQVKEAIKQVFDKPT